MGRTGAGAQRDPDQSARWHDAWSRFPSGQPLDAGSGFGVAVPPASSRSPHPALARDRSSPVVPRQAVEQTEAPATPTVDVHHRWHHRDPVDPLAGGHAPAAGQLRHTGIVPDRSVLSVSHPCWSESLPRSRVGRIPGARDPAERDPLDRMAKATATHQHRPGSLHRLHVVRRRLSVRRSRDGSKGRRQVPADRRPHPRSVHLVWHLHRELF